MTFLESPRFPTDINYTVVSGVAYLTDIVVSGAGIESANSLSPQPRHQYDIVYAVKDKSTIERLQHFFHAMRGPFHGFRFKDVLDFKSSQTDSPISAFNQVMLGEVNGRNTRFQLTKSYTQGALRTMRKITKPLLQTVRIAVSNKEFNSDFYSLDDTTGQIDFKESTQGTITNITPGYPSRVYARNTVTEGNSVYILGIEGMIELNNKRFAVIECSITSLYLDVDSTDFTPYESGGNFNTLPEIGEQVTAGFEFDVPVRFAQDSLNVRIDAPNNLSVTACPLIEIFV